MLSHTVSYKCLNIHSLHRQGEIIIWMLPFDRSWAASASNVSVVLVVKNLPANAEIRHRSSIPRSKDPLEEGTATHSSILGESHGQRSLVDYSPWNAKRCTRLKQFCTHTCKHILIIEPFMMEMLWETNKGCSSEGTASFRNQYVGWLLFAGLRNYLRCEFWRGIWNFSLSFLKI